MFNRHPTSQAGRRRFDPGLPLLKSISHKLSENGVPQNTSIRKSRGILDSRFQHVQLCIVHLVRNSLNYVGWRERKAVAADLKEIYGAPTAEAAADELKRFGEKWGKPYTTITTLWQRNWERIIPFFAFPAEVRKIIFTNHKGEALKRSLRKIIKSR